MKNKFFSSLYLVVRIAWIAALLAPVSLAFPFHPAMAQETDDWALQFEGATDHVLLSDTANIIGTGWETTKSVNLWVKPTGVNACIDNGVASCDSIFGDKPRSWGISIGGFTTVPPDPPRNLPDRIYVWNDDGNFDFIGIPYTPNEWVNIALVHAGGVLRAYKNGVLAGSVASGATILFDSVPKLYIGGVTAGPEQILIFNGQIDEVHIWNVALNVADIIDQMYFPTAPGTPGLKAYYQMSDGPTTPPIEPPTPQYLTDDSGNGWTGTFMDGTPPDVSGDGHYAQWVIRPLIDIPNPPTAPSNLTAIAASFHRVDLSWNDNSIDEFSFEIERCIGIGCNNFALSATVLDSPGVGVINYGDTNVDIGTSYCYRVRAANTGGQSGYTIPSACATVPFPIFLPMLFRR